MTMRDLQLAGTFEAFRQQTSIYHVTANNLSNSQTVGFKRDVPVFEALLSRSGPRRNVPGEIGQTVTSFTQGPLQQTGNPLDIAIEGEGFFKVLTPRGLRYTRAGNFKLDKDRRLVNGNGYPVLGGRGEVSLKGTQIVIEGNGAIKVDGQQVDKIVPVRLPDAALLRKEEQTLFCFEGEDEGIENGEARVVQGVLEMSNVDPVAEMVSLIDSIRSYETLIKITQSNDEMDGKAVNEIGRL
jgi:flagellar basal-body rod protein FlgF